MRFLTYAPILAAIWLPSGAIAATQFIPDCAGPVEIAHARVARVEQNGALVLDDGRTVMLEGIRLPGADGAPHDLTSRALGLLRDLALAGPVTFTTISPKKDRYGRVRAQAFAPAGDADHAKGVRWLQRALLEQGLARVAISPDRNECAPDLYQAEQRGRASKSGLWTLSANAPRSPAAMKRASGFQIVDGWVSAVAHHDGLAFIDFGNDGQRIFSAVILPEDRRAFRGFDLDGLEARHIRIRGIVQDYRGWPQMALSNPAQIEILGKEKTRHFAAPGFFTDRGSVSR